MIENLQIMLGWLLYSVQYLNSLGWLVMGDLIKINATFFRLVGIQHIVFLIRNSPLSNMSDRERIAALDFFKKSTVNDSLVNRANHSQKTSNSHKNVFFVCFWQFSSLLCQRANRYHCSSLSRCLQKSDLERFAPVAHDKRVTGAIRSFSRACRSFAHKKWAIRSRNKWANSQPFQKPWQAPICVSRRGWQSPAKDNVPSRKRGQRWQKNEGEKCRKCPDFYALMREHSQEVQFPRYPVIASTQRLIQYFLTKHRAVPRTDDKQYYLSSV